jgi:hypothetical protein
LQSLGRWPIALGRRASLLVSASVIAHTLWTSAAPAMAYRLYADEWHNLIGGMENGNASDRGKDFLGLWRAAADRID